MSRDELAYARCTPPEDFECHMEGGWGGGDGETMCRGHWEAYKAAERKGIDADESADERIDWDAGMGNQPILEMNDQVEPRRK